MDGDCSATHGCSVDSLPNAAVDLHEVWRFLPKVARFQPTPASFQEEPLDGM